MYSVCVWALVALSYTYLTQKTLNTTHTYITSQKEHCKLAIDVWLHNNRHTCSRAQKKQSEQYNTTQITHRKNLHTQKEYIILKIKFCTFIKTYQVQLKYVIKITQKFSNCVVRCESDDDVHLCCNYIFSYLWLLYLFAW